MSDYGRRRRKGSAGSGSARSAYGGGYNKGRGYGSGSFHGDQNKEDPPKVYSISVKKLVGNPNVDNTKYTHHPYPCCCPKKNWCPPRGIPPFCFQQKTLSLQINRSGNGGPPDCCYKAATCRDINYDANDGSPPKRKVYCRFQNPGMPCCPVCLECCPIVNGNASGNNKKDGGSKGVGNTTAKGPPEVNPNSPFFNNCNFYNITCGTGTPQAKEPKAKKKSRSSRSRSFSSYNYNYNNYPYPLKGSSSKGASEEKGSDLDLGPDMDYLDRRSSSLRQNDAAGPVEVKTDDPPPPPAGPRFNTISTPKDV